MWHRWVKFHTRGGVENFSVYSDWTAWSDAMLLTRLLASWSECKGGGGEGGEERRRRGVEATKKDRNFDECF